MSHLLKVQQSRGVLLSTLDEIPRAPIQRCFGAVTGQGILGANFVKDMMARMHDTLGGAVGGYEKAMDAAMARALSDMAESARECGANAVVGIRMQTMIFGDKGMMMATCVGTAVDIETS